MCCRCVSDERSSGCAKPHFSICHPEQVMACCNTRGTHTCNYTDRVSVKHMADICDLFLFICKPDMQNPVKLLPCRSRWTTSPRCLQMTQRLERKMGFGRPFGEKSQCASDKSTGIATFSAICRCAPRPFCSTVGT